MRTLQNTLTSFFLLLLLLVALGCARDRPLRRVAGNQARIPKSLLLGRTYLYLKSAPYVSSPGTKHGELAPGSYLQSDQLVRFVVTADTLDVVSIEPGYRLETATVANGMLASFPVRHVDVLAKQSPDGEATQEEEETETRRPFQQREFLVVDFSHDKLDALNPSTLLGQLVEMPQLAPDGDFLQFSVSRRLDDETQVLERYSFRRFTPSSTYVQRLYPKETQLHFGFSKTTAYHFDKTGRITDSAKVEFMNRWDISQPIVFHLSSDFPQHLINTVDRVVKEWSLQIEAAGGRGVRWEKNSGQELGDIRYNVIAYDPTPSDSHGLMGYGPSFSNPRTGEIIKADVVLYGGALRRSVYNARLWQDIMPIPGLINFTRYRLADDFRGRRELNPEQVQSVANALRPLTVTTLTRPFTKRICERPFPPEAAMTLATRGEQTDEELENQVFASLLRHEMGHALGLGHNFRASTDKIHFADRLSSSREPAPTTEEGTSPIPKESTSSVMDYMLLPQEEPLGLGSYDRAAIEVLYGSAQKTAPLIDRNFAYCNDEQAGTSGDAFCNAFDSGTTLTEIVEHHNSKFFGSYLFQNLRLNRATFPAEANHYTEKVQRYLLPLRNAYDFTAATAEANSRGSLPSLWEMFRSRIEADDSSKKANIVRVQVTSGASVVTGSGVIGLIPRTVTRHVDLEKVSIALSDASQAQASSFEALARVVFNSVRPNYDATDQLHHELYVRGVLPDKLFALGYLLIKTPSPLGEGLKTFPFASLPGENAAHFLAELLSSTQLPKQGQPHDLRSLDPNLRELALQWFEKELFASSDTAEKREIFECEPQKLGPLPARERAAFEAVGKLRAEIVDLFEKRETQDLNDEEFKALNQRIEALEMERDKIGWAFLPAGGDLYWVAPLQTAQGLPTASGQLIRGNINHVQDQLAVVARATQRLELELDAESMMPADKKNPVLIKRLQANLLSWNSLASAIRGHIAFETRVLERFYRIYVPWSRLPNPGE